MRAEGSAAALFDRRTLVLFAVAAGATLLTVALQLAGATHEVVFIVSAVALAGLASVVGEGTDQLGSRLGAGATGVLQSALGNLPELFISIFALKAGLVVLVQTALVGSILANSLLVLGLAFLAGGLRNGVQRFGVNQVRMVATLLVLAVAALTIPTVATAPGAPDAGHDRDLSLIVAIVVLVVFVASVPFSIGGGPGASAIASPVEHAWPLPLALGVLTVSGVAAAFVSDWFVNALQPAMATFGMSEAFVGLVIVAIAGNAVENVVGIQAAYRNQSDLAISLILNSSLQVALAMTPALVLISVVLGGPMLTLVLPPLLIVSLALAAILGALVVFDGESTWLEGLALVGLYLIIAASTWWGPRIGT
ncbi:MAG TPA: calcium/proton exchanger [Candidatus Limnocylindrales bacterium]